MSLQEVLLVHTEQHLNPKLHRLAHSLQQDGLVSISHWPEEGITETFAERMVRLLPDLVLIDLASWDQKDLDQVQHLCRQVEQASEQDYKPVIILLTHGENTHQRIEYFVNGADDILSSHMEEDELRVRLLAHLRRNLDLLSDKVTQLPSYAVAKRLLLRKLSKRHSGAVLLCTVQQFNAYTSSYGQVPAQQVLQQTARLLGSLLVPPDWLCQGKSLPGGATLSTEQNRLPSASFLLLTQNDKAEKLAAIACRRFDQLQRSFYSEQDQQQGYFVSVEGSLSCRCALMNLTIGLVYADAELGWPASPEEWLDNAHHLAFLAKHSSTSKATLSSKKKNGLPTTPPPSSKWVGQRLKLSVQQQQQAESPLQEGDTTVLRQPTKPRVLIIESDAALAYLLQTTLEMQGYEAEALSNETEAIDAMKRFKPWLVVLDSVLNDKAVGFELCHQLKEERPTCKVMFLSSLHEREKALQAGADFYLPKPFELLPLLSTLSRTLEELKTVGGPCGMYSIAETPSSR